MNYKKIAITQRLIKNEDYYELREALDTRWALLFNEINFLPIILPYNYNFENYFKSMNIDGILLTGGNDLNSINNNSESRTRDSFEKKLIEYAILNEIPILGICRGMQVIAEYFGADFIRVENQVNITHKLKINKKSKYFKQLARLDTVNSFHNYAVKNIPKDLMISASSQSNIIKAIEHKNYKIFGQMWHSERETTFKNDELKLIKDFFNKELQI